MNKDANSNYMGITTQGENIVSQIIDEDVYGGYNNLTIGDVYNIIDTLYTHFLDTNRDAKFLEKWLDDLDTM